MTHRLAMLCVLLLGVALPGCANTGGKTATEVGIPTSQLKYPGFETYPTPREFDGPGTVFEQDAKGFMRYVMTIDVSVDPEPKKEDLGSLVGYSDMSLAAVARVLEATDDLDLGGSFATSSGAVKSAVLGDGYRARPRVSVEAKVQEAVDGGALSLKPNTRYWIVRETIQVDKLRFVLSDWTARHAGFVAKLPQVDVGASANTSRVATKTVGRDYDARRNLFYYRDEILPAAAGISTGPESKVRVVEVSEVQKPKVAGFGIER